MKALALPTQIETAVKPKPTKAEILDALTKVAIQKMMAEEQRLIERREALIAQVEEAVHKLLVRKIKSVKPDNSYRGYFEIKDGLPHVSKVELTYHVNDIPLAIAKMIGEINKLPSRPSNISEREVRQQIRDKMRGMDSREDRVDALLATPETRAALEKTLEALEAE